MWRKREKINKRSRALIVQQDTSNIYPKLSKFQRKFSVWSGHDVYALICIQVTLTWHMCMFSDGGWMFGWRHVAQWQSMCFIKEHLHCSQTNFLFPLCFSLLSQPNKVVILSHFQLSNVVTSTKRWSAKCTQRRQFWGWDCQCLGDQSNLQRAHTHQTSRYNVLPSNPRPGVLKQMKQEKKKLNPCSLFFSYVTL